MINSRFQDQEISEYYLFTIHPTADPTPGKWRIPHNFLQVSVAYALQYPGQILQEIKKRRTS
jgi:hypothetical protein